MNHPFLKEISSSFRTEFEANCHQMSFVEFLSLVEQAPEVHLRNSVQYLRDCFLYFGFENVENYKQFALFNTPFEQNADRLIGQVAAQNAVFKLLQGFVQQGKINKLILLHGPNGSAKSTFINTIMAALEAYSHTTEGALYRFNWVFPIEKIVSKSSIGFGGQSAVDPSVLETFAHLTDDQVDAKLQSDLNDHPMLVLPQSHRRPFFNALLDDSSDFVLSDYLAFGDLSHTSRQIFDALLSSYEGNIERLLKHIQVERFYISRRYRQGAVTVEPQMRVDAGLRQLTADRSLSALPPILQNKTLFEPYGDLVDANRGMIQYDDLLKRHPDLNKYLLSTGEKATVSLDSRILYLDMVLIATANEDYLDAYKQSADYISFKGRVEFVRFPYLLSYLDEQHIYDEHVSQIKIHQHVAPHTTFVAALWAVLTRLHKPNSDLYSREIRPAISKLSPLEKADLYASKTPPKKLGTDQSREILELIQELQNETTSTGAYEGRFGASPREMKVMLVSANQNHDQNHLSPIAVIAEFKKIVVEPNVYPFLQMPPDGGYRNPDSFIELVQNRYLDIVDLEVRTAMNLIDDKAYGTLFERYLNHVSHQKRNEKVYDKSLKKHVEPSEKFMLEVESYFRDSDESAASFRDELISSIAAWSIDHPEEDIEYKEVFPQIFNQMHEHFFSGRSQTIRKNIEIMINFHEENAASFSSEDKKIAKDTLLVLTGRYKYNTESALEMIAFLYSNRYRNI